ncbi:hypothetical protein LXA13_18140, partial [Erwinia amylovora]|nr:hypothetical protein [Erwinia amylovora]
MDQEVAVYVFGVRLLDIKVVMRTVAYGIG